MPRIGSTPFAFPEFRGATRSLVLWNIAAYFALALTGWLLPSLYLNLRSYLEFTPAGFLLGQFWQAVTYSFIHPTLPGALFELISLWFLAGFLESTRERGWVLGLYFTSVIGAALAALVLHLLVFDVFRAAPVTVALSGCFGGIFGLLVAIGLLYGDTQFLLFFTIGIKARYLVAIYALVSIAMLFGDQRFFAFAELGGAVAGWFWIRLAPRRGFGFALSESWYGLRNRYYRWKRRRASRKFEVYMRSQGRNVRLDGQGRQLDDHDDKKRWN